MTFIVLTCGPLLAAVLLLRWQPREPRRRRLAPTPKPRATARPPVEHRSPAQLMLRARA
ncbi:hypothetical protein [Streptomyces sp. NPDC052114]|uniref:hypothetical protein n=1 Tax=unclassified Streptomyces TaxID=2593676 RepID=UPI00341CF869